MEGWQNLNRTLLKTGVHACDNWEMGAPEKPG